MIDMAGTLNALGLLFVIGLTVVMLRRHGRFPKRFQPVLYGLLLAAVSLVIATVFTTHMCNAGQPVTQLLIPCACFAICYAAFEEPNSPRWVLAVLFFAPLALGFHYTIIVHSEGYTGNTRDINRAPRAQQRSNIHQLSLEYVYEFQNQPAALNRSYPAGPLASSAAWEMLVDKSAGSKENNNPDRLLTSKAYRTHWLWHTWLTGIYGVSSRPLKLWYPGGKLKDAVQQLEYR